jgi:hypothetical protein
MPAKRRRTDLMATKSRKTLSTTTKRIKGKKPHRFLPSDVAEEEKTRSRGVEKWSSTAASPTAHWRQLAQALAHVLPGECFPAAVTQIVVEYARRVVVVACNRKCFFCFDLWDYLIQDSAVPVASASASDPAAVTAAASASAATASASAPHSKALLGQYPFSEIIEVWRADPEMEGLRMFPSVRAFTAIPQHHQIAGALWDRFCVLSPVCFKSCACVCSVCGDGQILL